MYDFFSIYILQYGRWIDYRQAVSLSKEYSSNHIVHALDEIQLYGPSHVTDIKIILRGYECLEDEDGNPITDIDDEDGSIYNIEATHEVEVNLSDFNNFTEFKESFLSSKFPM